MRFVLLTLASVLAAMISSPSVAQDRTPDKVALSHFAYDKGAPLNLKQISVHDRDGATVHDITYTGYNGDTVPAYLVIPKGSGKFAGIIWGHWMMKGVTNANRTEFLDEAIALAPAGVVSLMIDTPPNRPDFKPPAGPEVISQQVVDLRRGMDVLLSRPDIDATRIGYVGHSFDSNIGAILDAADKRFSAFVFMGGPQKLDSQAAWTNPGSYANALGPASALFQYGLHDEIAPIAAAKEYVETASGPKTVEFYDAGHALNGKARLDRDEFLSKVLRLKRNADQ